VDWAKSLNDEYLNEQSHRMNQVVYILTLVTIMVLPAQFFTG
jgi:Mg2+ and Co2+ transporter CorA